MSPRPKPGTVLAFLLIEWPLRFASRLAGRSRRRRRRGRADLRRTRRSERSWDQRQGNPQGCAGARRSSDGERPSGTGQTRCAPRSKTCAGRKQGRPQVGSSPRRGAIGPAGEVHSAFGMRHLPHFVQQPGKAGGCGFSGFRRSRRKAAKARCRSFVPIGVELPPAKFAVRLRRLDVWI